MKQAMTRVVFRRYDVGCEIIALFPDEVADNRGNCSSYLHNGQHGAADYTGVVRSTKPVTRPEEYARLKRELESAPFNYNLRVVRHR